MQGLSAARITRTANADGRGATVGLARHGTYRAQDPARDADRSLVVPREPHHLQPAAGLSGRAAAGRTR